MRNRREFLEDSMFAAAAAVAARSPSELLGGPPESSASPHERLGIALVGLRGRGGSHVGAFAGRRDVEILYLCDVDSVVGQKRLGEVGKRQSRSPQLVEDLRTALDDPRVDIVSIATPNHLHALQAIWSLQAGKDVYLEAPASHNVSEGRRIVEAARKYRRLCQVGMQSRSNLGVISAMEYLHQGHLGRPLSAKGICFQRRPSIGPRVKAAPPPHVNYDLWLGPAEVQPVTRQQFHYDWNWQWEFGNGALGQQGVHQLDIASWGLNQNRLSDRVFSYGGRFGVCDVGDTANTQVVVHDFGDQTLSLEVRGLARRGERHAKTGVLFECHDGFLVMRGYQKGAAFDPEGRVVAEFAGGGDHVGSFLRAVRSRRMQDLHADIELGHLASSLVHFGNISYRLGNQMSLAEAKRAVLSNTASPLPAATLEGMIDHLDQQAIDLATSPLIVGKSLELDGETETVRDSTAANALLTRAYRAPFVVPAAGQV